MAKRFHISFNTLLNEDWTAEVHDADYVGTSAEINGRYLGFRMDMEALDQQGSADMFSPVLASSVRFDMLIEDVGMDTFITDLATSREGRFHLVLYRGGTSSSDLEWIGPIVADEVRGADQYFPYNLSLFAIDGMSRLKEMDYKNPATGFKYTGRQTALQHFYNIIEIIGLTGIVTMPAQHFKTNFNWYSDSMAVGSGNNGLTQCDIDHIVFQATDREGNEVIWNCFEVLSALCRGFGGRFLMANGHWWFLQPAEYTTTTQAIWTFDDAGTQIGYNAGTSFDKAINFTTRHKLNGGGYTFLRPMKKVIVDYHHLSGNNRAEGVTFSNSAPGSLTSLPGIVAVDNFNESQLHATIKIKVRTNELDISLIPGTPYNVYPPHRYKFLITLKIGSYYLDNTVSGNILNLQPSHLEWKVSTQTVEVYSPLISEQTDNTDIPLEVEIITDDLFPVMSGNNIQYHIALDKVLDIDGNEITTDGALQSAWYRWENHYNNIYIENEGIGNAPSQDVLRTEVEDAAEGNTGIYKIDTYFGDGPFPFSLSRLADGGANTENWKVGANDGTISITELLANEVLALRQQAALVYQGTYFAGDIFPFSRMVDAGNAYIPIRLSYSAFTDQWEGDFVQVADGVFTPTTNGPFTPGIGNTGGPIKLPPGIPGISTGNITENTSNLVANANSNSSATTTSTGILAAAVNPSVSVVAVPYSFVRQGDQINIVNPATGEPQTFTVAATPAPNATSLSLTGTAANSIPAGAYVQPVPAVVYDRGFNKITRDFTGVSGDGVTWPISTTIGILPQLATVGEDEMRRRIRVWRSGVRVFYSPVGSPYPDAFYTTTDRIIFHQKVRGETVYVEVVT